ncbi:MAG TPA: LAGLIDADG family homing endonuclease [Acidimicrobiales bacterium]|nr:LAGLIDADG family homing endonuclease [Acidimicrobiales bacterium]
MAMAPERMGIGIRRHFTVEGTHPYDEVAWDRRDARITNWLDGTVAFEQLGVEVPSTWSVNATNILAQKYFRGNPGTPEREWSLRQVIDRVADTVTGWGMKDGYFVSSDEAEAFCAELKHLVVTQKAAFNSPVWFNIGVRGRPAQASACFILSVDDTMDDILNWYVEEGTIFKGGSGAGVNLSRIRSSKERLGGGGTASGPVSFMRGADASAGTIKSGGVTRRAAKMVILDVDHPDIEEFIWCKAIEERKARALRDAGFDMDLDGRDSHSIQYQNANNSVRVTDEFMQAVVDDKPWQLRARTTGEVVQTVRARDLFRQIAQATWECADPGMQFDTTINRWHTAANTGRINGSNPCFTGDSLVHTDKGLIAFRELFDRANHGEAFRVYTHDATNPDAPASHLALTTPEAFLITGLNPIVRLRFDNGMEVRCTPGHRLFTTNRGYVEASELTPDDAVHVLDLPAPAAAAHRAIPVSTDVDDYRGKGEHADLLRLPEEWSAEFAHYLGWLVGDGSTSGPSTVTVYGSADDRTEILPAHQDLLHWINGDRPLKVSEQENATAQLRLSRRPFKRFLEALGVAGVTGPGKRVPWSIQQAPSDVAASFLRGLYDADGCVRVDGAKGSYVGLGSVSRALLVDVQRLLTTYGIASRISAVHAGWDSGHPPYTRKDGTDVTYGRSPSFDLRITSRSIERFASHIGFSLSAKSAALLSVIEGRTRGFYDVTTAAHLVERTDEGVELTYNLSEPRNHSYVVNGLVVRNCSEYMHLDNSACNLASLNLLKFLSVDGTFDVEGFRAAVSVVFTAQEILVGNADYPTQKIAETSRRFRQLGIGYANLGALLMAEGMPYDSDDGRAWAGALTALLTGTSYATSARIAARMGPFAGYHDNAEHMNRVLRMHRDEVAKIDEERVPPELLSAAQEEWDTAVELGQAYGVRNSQASVLAPTGCLVGGSLVATDRGLVRLRSLGDVDGAQWQDLDVTVQTDEGPRRTSKFYVNGLEPVVTVDTGRGYRIQGTPQHRVKVVDPATGAWEWKRLADIAEGDVVPLGLDQLVGEPQVVPLPPLPEAYWTGEHTATAPRRMTAELAELIGYFMGDGSLHARGLRFCVTEGDFDVVDRLRQLAKEVFGLPVAIAPKQGYTEVRIDSVRVVLWWEACGLAKHLPTEAHTGKGHVPHIPDAVLHANDRDVYAGFLRGLFEADGTVTNGYPVWSTISLDLARDVQSLMLALGFPSTRKVQSNRTGWGAAPLGVVRLLNLAAGARWLEQVGFMGGRKTALVLSTNVSQAGRYDYIPFTRELVDRLAPDNDRLRKVLLTELGRNRVSRRIATELHERTGDPELGRLLSFFYDRVASATLGEEELTYDLSVPDNLTYLANGFVSHNTIGLLMDCDTTGIEPDLGLVKSKKLVGGGTMQIVNQTVPRALRRLGYTDAQVADIVAYIDTNKSALGAPHLSPDHLAVFACSMGDNPIHHLGHVRMMAAVQPFISGAISKCVTGDTLLATSDGLVRIGSLHEGEAPDTFRSEIREVASLDGLQKTDAFYYGGLRETHHVVLRSGHRIAGTPNHRLLVATDGDGGVEWRRLDELAEGDAVAVQYGADLWSSVPAHVGDFRPTPAAGTAKRVRVPAEMTDELAVLLGMFAAAGEITRSTWTVTVSCDADPVLERLAWLWRSLFGVAARIVRPDGETPAVVVSSRTIVEFLDHLGAGGREASRRIPDAVLTSPRSVVVSFLEGLALAAHVAAASTWTLGVASPALLDDLQAVLANLGIVHERLLLRNADGTVRHELQASGVHAQRLVSLAPFWEPAKVARAAELAARSFPADPVGPDGLRFSPVVSVDPGGMREVFDVSVPVTKAFVGNGIVNHNTVNLPETATVEEMEQLHIDAWRMGLKAVAVYRDNCKVAQPLSSVKKDEPKSAAQAHDQELAEKVAELEKALDRQTVVVKKPIRERLPRKRRSCTFAFRVADCEGYVTVGEYDDGRPGEVFMKVSKQGSTLAGVMDAFSISVSLGLQHGVPLRTFVQKYTNMRFEPAGMTDDPDLRIASSLVDYIFRRLAVDYLPADERAELGILTTEERIQPTLPGVDEAVTRDEPVVDVARVAPPAAHSDAPFCMTCGVQMVRAGSCHACPSCGSTSGCS